MQPIKDFLTASDYRNTVAIVVALASIAVTTLIFRLNRKKKSLTYEFLAMTRLLSVQEAIAGRVHVFVDNEEVRDVGLVQIRIMNTGTDPIKASEFVRPISFVVGPTARILEAEVSERNPASIDCSLRIDDHIVTMLPTLLNSKDWVVIKCLIADFDGKIGVDSRIEGLELKPKTSIGDSKWAPIILGAFKLTLAIQGLGASATLGLLDDRSRNDYKKSE